ncbi:SH3 domain-containing protein [Sphingomonas profundi]|uniref:SH3 domain-containing protein n=1 Tax=Alterirhizorhabdus profundi TaxID=2681549 RepID=UPI001E431E78|nr:SH3 domain-containing protein [Sphingomonas profundi]
MTADGRVTGMRGGSIGAWAAGGWLAAAMAVPAPAVAQKAREVPYWASISAPKARMRTGPGTNYPANWEYVRAELPVKVMQVRNEWRRIVDPDGVEGWMRSFLLSEQRTAIIRGEIRPLRAAPDRGAKVTWRAEPGVVGKVSHCAAGWCEFDVHGRAGYVEIDHIWGVAAGETID